MNSKNAIARKASRGKQKTNRPNASNRTWTWFVLGVFLLLATQTVHAADPLRQQLLDALRDIEDEIRAWENNGSLELLAIIAIGVIGLIIAGLQTLTFRGVKLATGILGLVSGALVLVNNNYFDADHRAYRSLARQSKQLVRDFKLQLAPYSDPLMIDDFKFLCEKFKELGGAIRDLERPVFGKNAIPAAQVLNGSLSFSLISTAYAIEGANAIPEWAKTVPVDADNIYFLGVVNDRSASAAQTAAKQQAKNAVESSFESALRSYPQIPAEDVSHLAREISGSGEMVSTFVVPGSGGYRGYALVRVPRSFTAVSAKSFFLAHKMPFDPKFLDQIVSGNKVKEAATVDAREQRAAAQAGVAYIHVVDENDRGIGEALRKDLSAVVSAPGVQLAVSDPPNTVRYFNADDAGLAQTVKDRAQNYLAAEGYPTELKIENLSGTPVKGQSKQIEVWLGRVPQIKPRVYVAVDKDTPPAKLQLLKARLEQNDYEVHLAEAPTDLPNAEAKIFYYRDSDEAEAQALVSQLSGLGVSGARDAATKVKGPADARPRHFDLRVGKDALTGKY